MACGSSAQDPGNQALLLGVEPVPGPDDAGVAATEFVVHVGGLNAEGGLSLPAASSVTATCTGSPCAPLDDGVQRPGANVGVLAIILDNSGSNGATPSTCTGCPTDPTDLRAEGIRVLIRRLLGRAPGWRVGLFEFGFFPNGGHEAANLLAGYSSYPADFDGPLNAVSAGGSTFIFDSLVDVLPTVAGERVAFDGGVPGRVLVVSDGEDTSSVKTRAEALALARQFGLTIDTVGYGQRSDAGTVVLAPRAYRDLRRLANETGGFCTVVSADELPALFARIGELYVAGYAERRFQMPSTGAVVSGRAGLTAGPSSAFLFEDFR